MFPELSSSYSTICSKELMMKVLPDYCIDNPLDCLFWERGTNDTYQVRCADARYSLRIYRHDIYPRGEIDFEVEALNYLHNNGFPVAFPIARKSGGYITEIMAPEGIRYVLLTAFVDGKTLEFESLDDSRIFGESVANLHEISQGFKTHHKKKDLNLQNFIDDSIVAIEPYVSHRPEDLSLLSQLAANARAAVQKTDESVLDIGFCHGDLHGYNAHLNGDVVTHYDFEECGFGYRIFDLATFKWSFVFDDSGADQWLAFLDGYQSVRKASEADLQLLDTFVLLRHIWIIAFHMRNANDFGYDMASDGYIDHQWKRLRKLAKNIEGAD